ncbi:hypothetical protein BH11BAC2_BH11BAC2_07530 [soil metagenome]
MRKLLLFLLVLVQTVAFAAVGESDFPPLPNPPKLVTDYTNTLSEEEKGLLEQKLVAYDDSTSVQLAVVIMASVGAYEISDYAFKLAQQWGIGNKKTNNGALLLVALTDRKMFIATGYGMEGVMPDALCKRIVEEDIKPFFKNAQYYEGIDKGTDQMMALAKGDYKASAPSRTRGRVQGVPWFAILIFIFVFIMVFLVKIRSVKKYALLNNIPFLVAWQLLNAAANRNSGKWGNFNSGSGGFGGWSGGGGSSSSGGGFGGFGGGSFGGGGAGGSW